MGKTFQNHWFSTYPKKLSSQKAHLISEELKSQEEWKGSEMHSHLPHYDRNCKTTADTFVKSVMKLEKKES